MVEVVVVIGAGSIGQAIARRVSTGRHVLLADLRPEHAQAVTELFLDAGFDASMATVDISSRSSVHDLAEHAAALGGVVGLVHAGEVKHLYAVAIALKPANLAAVG